MRIVTYFSLVLSAGLLLACGDEPSATATSATEVVQESTATVAPSTAPPASSTTPPSADAVAPKAGDEAGARLVVDEFGRRMRNISKLAPRDQVAAALRAQYGGLVVPALLDRWIASPEAAPGRSVSSPWPDHIEVTDVSSAGDRVTVRGVVVNMTSTGVAGRDPVRTTLVRRNGKWLISEFDLTTAPADREPEPKSDAAVAVQVVEKYYEAIAAHDYKRAWSYWGANGAPGQTFESFRKGFEDTADVSVDTGAASRVEAAAGSRYITVPVVVTAKTTQGARQTFEGTYTLRRAVVDGAAAWQRAWHLEQAKLRRTNGPGRGVRSE